ncbi:hypothetical protein [Leptospira adleri]|uniref:Uncharacterized protein n=1 Tax=Leptospira adleri TaxID=2023186 RepID=A0A2M9YQW8_9LEPT|nr:hypothetical protein [Leptospira adleri]PJZ53921.1 hypothetical protein CH380_07915 [Leptospira adleri]PJZ62009.1 hypothetical protein CH376_10120 [Leptospira adleri]
MIKKWVDVFQIIPIFYRILSLGYGVYLIFGVAIPDLKYNYEKKNRKEFTFEEFVSTPADQIPRYVKIKDVVPAYDYVEFSKHDRLESIAFMVTSLEKAGSKNVKVIVKDSDVTQEEFDNSTYFSSLSFSIEGRFSDDALFGDRAVSFYKSKGYVLDRPVYLIERGDEPLGLIPALGLMIAVLIFEIFIVVSLFPDNVLEKIFRSQSESPRENSGL